MNAKRFIFSVKQYFLSNKDCDLSAKHFSTRGKNQVMGVKQHEAGGK